MGGKEVALELCGLFLLLGGLVDEAEVFSSFPVVYLQGRPHSGALEIEAQQMSTALFCDRPADSSPACRVKHGKREKAKHAVEIFFFCCTIAVHSLCWHKDGTVSQGESEPAYCAVCHKDDQQVTTHHQACFCHKACAGCC